MPKVELLVIFRLLARAKKMENIDQYYTKNTTSPKETTSAPHLVCQKNFFPNHYIANMLKKILTEFSDLIPQKYEKMNCKKIVIFGTYLL